MLDVWLGSKFTSGAGKLSTLGTLNIPPSSFSARPICKSESFFHPKFSTFLRYTCPLLPQCEDLHCESPPSTKQNISPVTLAKNLKTLPMPYLQNSLSPKQRPNTQKVLRGLHSHGLKPGSLWWESGALLMHHSVLELGRPLWVLFKFSLMTPFLTKHSV